MLPAPPPRITNTTNAIAHLSRNTDEVYRAAVLTALASAATPMAPAATVVQHKQTAAAAGRPRL